MESVTALYRRELLKGSTETILLSLLSSRPMYGHELIREMDERTSGYFRFKEGTLYPALHRLERDGFIEGRWEPSPSGQSRRYYYITALGHRGLVSMLEEWQLFTRAVNLVAQPDTT
jgi:PadR family transcriptional regulator PadR